jgi:hypothetical protein
VLDLFHVLERLWAVAHCFHKEESDEAKEFGVRPVKATLDGACEPSAQADRTSVRGQNSPHRSSADPQPSRALRVAEPLGLQRIRPLLPLM